MVAQYKAFWSIPNAGPSVSTFHAAGTGLLFPQEFADAVGALFATLPTRIPNEVAVSFDTEVTEIDENTGQLVGALAVTPPTTVEGDGSGVWAAGSGARIVWATSVIRDGRRVRGTTFLVPLAANQYDSDGRILPATITGITGGANTYLDDLDAAGYTAVVYSRPRPGIPGAASSVVSASVPSLVATLRGRKY